MLMSFKQKFCGFDVRACVVGSYVLFRSLEDCEGRITITGGQG